MGISTHVLDTARGKPAAGIHITLEIHDGERWSTVAEGQTDDDGRLRTLTDGVELEEAIYRLTFDIGAYNATSFFPEVSIVFEVADAEQHYHVPLLLSPFGYSTYRGS